MKQTLVLTILAMLTYIHGYSQNNSDNKYRFGVGLQYSSPVWGVSGKYAITGHSVVQAVVNVIAPIIKTTSSNASSSYYGLRYVYRFNTTRRSHPYAFVGLGLLEWLSGDDFNGKWTDAASTTIRYSLGGGYEWIVSNNFGISVEASFGNMSTSSYNGQILHRPAIGIGVHYYIHPAEKTVKPLQKPKQLD